MAALLGQENDIDIVAEVAHCQELLPTVGQHQPDVVVLDADLPRAGWRSACTDLCALVSHCSVLVLADARRSGRLWRGRPVWSPRVGFVANETPPARLVEAIREIARGEHVLDPELAMAALAALGNPFTLRELEVLKLAADGAPGREIASHLCLALGTVRNHLSRVIAKTGARNRLEAIRIARDTGWI